MNPIDLASDWLSKRGAAYLAKENVIVYYASTTGRKQDYQWITHTLVEVVRIIRATFMNPDDSDKKLQSKHIIAACQELDRVFDFAVKNKHTTRPDIFNYLKESGESMGDAVVSLLSEELFTQGYKAVLLKDVYWILDQSVLNLRIEMPVTEMRELVYKHFPTLGYEIRTGSSRPEFQGKKQNAVMLTTAKPREIIVLEDRVMSSIENKIVGALR